MAQGTKMTLKRYGNEVMYWNEQEIIVDRDYLDKGNGLSITLKHEYRHDTKQLDVFFNGHRLTEGIGYEEVDPFTIRLMLGIYPEGHPSTGKPIQLVLGDEIFIRIWKPEYSRCGGEVAGLRLKLLEEEVWKARQYRDTDTPHRSLDDRLDDMERRMETKTMVVAMNRVTPGLFKLDMRFPYAGTISEVYASCAKAGTERTVLQVEKCSQDSYDAGQEWTNIFKNNLVFDANSRSTKTSLSPYTLKDPHVSMGDHFRVHVAELGKGIEGVVLEIVVTLV
ncbi:hypothetical protein BLGI_2316 [Brevibacillus laterosporus GI-9]|uniref:hypothetical protein n=1 Tax=Brevibacillus laterosporus TaxID=1465 RepID=UPI0002403B49|nr:hypothetical protein [Brevibacillus laterosporus]CCF14390.1 hypothetical protein BLGI_2316 [Brevibacillus laterosporus GI-9]